MILKPTIMELYHPCSYQSTQIIAVKYSHRSLSISFPAHIVANEILMDMIRIWPLPSLKCEENICLVVITITLPST